MITAACTCPAGATDEEILAVGGHWSDCPRGIQIREAMQCACGCERPVWRWRLSERCAHLLAGMCLGKSRWPRGRKDLAAARRSPGQTTYECPVCAFVHNGGASGITPGIQEARQAIIAGLRRRGNGWILGVLAEGFATMDRIEWKNGRASGS